MTALPHALRRALAAALDEELGEARALGGGCINRAARVGLGRGACFVKWNDAAPPGFFEAEVRGLAALAATPALRSPAVMACSEAEGGAPAWLALEWLELQPRDAASDRALGEGLAALHRVTGPRWGLDRDNFIGSLPQDNRAAPDWPTFFGQRRLLALARGGASKLPTRVLRAVEQLVGRLPELLPAAPPASLLHGDLWGGNAARVGGTPVVFDPAIWYGDREVELAFTTLFGGFSRPFYEAYQAAWPLDGGWEQRRALYNLSPLLVHAILFGGSYVREVEATLARYA